ncbi:hypothetical protein [Anianabacter salinae]|uniref:hypothetical protein n=1 Tax=Anianabacter salinae TaxID=2851023 RepID=UPI002B1EFB24|nr:hypothetical protein [Anianabacter salinae]
MAALALQASALCAQAETRLLMAEEAGCMWCARWNAEVAPEYPLTAEGQAAPLLRVDIHDPLPDGITLDTRLHYTPTFVLIRDGQELARIEGYPGEDFFWGLLQRMLDDAGIDHDQAG